VPAEVVIAATLICIIALCLALGLLYPSEVCPKCLAINPYEGYNYYKCRECGHVWAKERPGDGYRG
jgi:hypothetical protein